MKKYLFAFTLIIALAISASGQDADEKNPLKTATDSLSYSFGVLIGNNLLVQGVPDIDQELFLQGFSNAYKDKEALISLEAANSFVQNYFSKQISGEAEMNLQKSNEFLAANKTVEGVVTLPSGLQYKVLRPGSGKSPEAGDQVKVHYHGTFIDGRVFDSSVERGEPIVFGVNQVIAGWTEALQLMQPGAKWILFIPPDLAYGDQGAGGVIGPNQALIFEVELIEVIK